MNTKTVLFSLFLISSLFFFSSLSAQERFFQPKELLADLSYLQQQLVDVHADPYRELDRRKMDDFFAAMRERINDSMTAATFFSLIKPAMAYLSDEHADINVPSYFNDQKVFLPFSLKAVGEHFIIDTVWPGAILKKGEEVTAVNGVAIAKLLQELSLLTTGFPEERSAKSLEQFGYLYGLGHPYDQNRVITLDKKRSVTINAITLSLWTDYLKSLYGFGGREQQVSYTKYDRTGYLVIPNFSVRNTEMDAYEKKIDSIFHLVDQDALQQLVIDVSNNSGGNSAAGNVLIDHFYGKPYRSYQMNWRRSKEYLATLKSYGAEDKEYESLSPGAILHRDAEEITPSSSTTKFKGKVFVVVGNGTFSSAIMFATIIKDNHIATLVGQTPKMGHPTHFGELYGTRLPNTKLNLRFGVKEWIRPIGKSVENLLRPDILLKEVDRASVLTAIRETAHY